jgi:phosphoadenosine phosphosulfate reductase
MTDVSLPWSDDAVAKLNQRFAAAPAAEIVRWTAGALHPDVTLATSFGLEDIVVAALLADQVDAPNVFFLDTGRLHEETYVVADAVTRQLGLALRVFSPDAAALEALTSEAGFYGFRASVDARRTCCGVRKVEPLRRALAGKRAWLTGLRAEQSPTRDALAAFERDDSHGGLLKINPLARWSQADVRAFIDRRGLPYNRLYDQGYPSIGCAPCTRAVGPGEDQRAGRWWWEQPEHKECGLHGRRPPSPPMSHPKEASP